MGELVRTIPWRKPADDDLTPLLEREWLITNALGGYACGTIAGASTRRYHGLLIAAHSAPLGRVMMLNHLTETFRFADWSSVAVGGTEKANEELEVSGAEMLTEFRLEWGLPVWHYESHGHTIEKRIVMSHRRNTVYVIYRMLGGDGPVRVKLRPSVHLRGHDDPVTTPAPEPYTLTVTGDRVELAARGDWPVLRLRAVGEHSALTLEEVRRPDVLFRVEKARGYEGVGELWSPGFFRLTLTKETPVYLIASTETWERSLALPPDEVLEAELDRRRKLLTWARPPAGDDFAAELVLAADQFIITPASRAADTARAQAAGDEARTVIAGYHWFTDWGRDTMISLEGLALVTGRHEEAGYILRTFASHVRDGLIPNFFPDRNSEGVYHTADATLWYFHALHRYLEWTGDRDTLRKLLPTLREIVARHRGGTRFGIGVDPADGLLRQGAEGYQLTWMDAKVGDWVVTPRRGKAVEINALWYNALRLLGGWLREAGQDDRPVRELAGRCRESFNRRFWCEPMRGLYDVVDGEHGDDPAVRPNQLLAISLPYPVLDPARWPAVVETCRDRLLTPVGLRTLAPGHPDYKSRYFGDLRARDAAYHQGTVWPWLVGPFLDAWVKTFPDRRGEARAMLSGFKDHLDEACVGSISEVTDAEAPFVPRGCAAQAWSVAEVLRCWLAYDPERVAPQGGVGPGAV